MPPSSPHVARFQRIVAVVLALFGMSLVACDSGELQLCGEIPEGGCPAGRGGSCDDTLCAGLYDCVEGAWTRVKSCPARMSGSGGGGGAGGAGGGEPCTPVTIDYVGEAAGCTPDLQEPDCPAAAADGCAESVCLTGCDDFFLCTKEGWAPVAYCDAAGQIVVYP